MQAASGLGDVSRTRDMTFLSGCEAQARCTRPAGGNYNDRALLSTILLAASVPIAKFVGSRQALNELRDRKDTRRL
jgi:hypothetical protein